MESKVKKLGLGALVALVISSSTGSGIFGIASDMADTTSPGAALIAWVITGIGVAMLCLSLTNLMNKRPELSGIFVYAEEGFGPFGGFISSWGYWLSAWLGNVAFATMLMSAVGYFFPVFEDGSNLISILTASIVLWLMFYLVNRGIESAAALNTIITICKLVPLFVFVVFAVFSFKAHLFTANFWDTASGNFELSSVASQITNTMMVLMWVFVGIEGAAMMNDRAESKKTASKATILGLAGLLVIYIFISMLPYGLLPREEIVAMGQPTMAYLMEYLVGPWGAILINIGLIISILGCWLSWTMLPAETTLLMAQRNLLPKKFGEVNAKNAPTFSLLFMTILTQMFVFTLLFTDKAYNFAYSLCTAALFITWLFVVLYQTKYSAQHIKESGAVKNLIIGIVGSVFYIWAIWASGIEYFLLCLTVYIIGIFFYYKARKELGAEKVFNGKELIVAAVILAGAIAAIVMLITGRITI